MTVFAWLVGLCLWADLLFPPGLAVYALIRWRGGWRVAAAAPLVVVVPARLLYWPSLHRPDRASPFPYVALSLAVGIYSLIVLLKYINRPIPKA